MLLRRLPCIVFIIAMRQSFSPEGGGGSVNKVAAGGGGEGGDNLTVSERQRRQRRLPLSSETFEGRKRDRQIC